MRVEFVKCHGSGNDFALIDARALAPEPADWSRIAVALSDRGGTVGSDGIVLLSEGDGAGTIGFRMFNADGSEAETCLNGLRCVARAGFEASGRTRLDVRLATSRATVARAPDLAPGVYGVRVTAGPASLDTAAWPLDIAARELIETPLAPLGPRAFTAVAMPNPHLVAFVEAIDDAELAALGAVCEAAPPWLPNRANVSFARVLAPDALFVRTCERGVGLTDSCGSAMAAASYAACLTGRIAWDREITVRNRGGFVRASAAADGGMVTLAGNATFDYRGWTEIDLAAGVAGPVTVTARYPDEIAAWRRLVAEAAPAT